MSCGGVVTDIFDVNNCVLAYNQCASTERVQVFLWQQIKKLQIFCNNFNEVQGSINSKTEQDIFNHEQAINQIKQQISNLETIASNLSTSQTQLTKDVNAFKLNVDDTLRLYQESINEIVKSVDLLRSDNQAMSNRLNVLESQTDLAALQQIIKTWEQINDKFSAELVTNTKNIMNEFDNFKKEVGVSLDGMRLDYTSQLNAFKIDVNASVADMLDTVLKNNEAVVKLSQSLTELSLTVADDAERAAGEFKALRALILETAGDTYDSSVAYTDKEIEKSDKRMQDALNAHAESVSSTLNNYFVKVDKLLDGMQQEITEFQRQYNIFKNMVEENFIAVNKAIEVLTVREKENYDLAYDAKRTANNALEIIVELQKSMQDWAKLLADVQYKEIYNAENIKRLFSPLVKGDFKNAPNTCVQVYNVKIKTGDGNSWIIEPVAPFRILLSSRRLATELDTKELDFPFKDTVLDFLTVNLETGERVRHFYYSTKDTIWTALVTPENSIVEDAYIKETPLVICDDVISVPVIDFHPAPEPQPEPVPDCAPLKVVLVNKQCEEIDIKPQPGRDGRDGLNGAGVTDVQLEVKDK